MRIKHVQHTVSQLLHSLGDFQMFSELFALERAFCSPVVNISSLVYEITHVFSPGKVHCLVHRNTEVTFPVQINVEDLKYALNCILADVFSSVNESAFVEIRAHVVNDFLEISMEILPLEDDYLQQLSAAHQTYLGFSTSDIHVMNVKNCIHVMDGRITFSQDPNYTLKLILPVEVF